MPRVARTEITRLDAVERLPNGGLRVPARLTRTGVLEYSDAEGKTWREYRPESEVFDPASLATLPSATVTDLHPTGLVTADNWSTLAKGHVERDVKRDGVFVDASLVVNDAAEVAMVDRRERVEISCGYTCEVDATPGTTPEGEPYDAVQRAIRYNHVALGPADWGRAGPECSLRLDGAAVHVRARADSKTAPVASPPVATRPSIPDVAATHAVRVDASARGSAMTIKLKVRGKEFALRTDASDAEMQKDAAAAQSEIDEQQQKSDEDSAQIDQLFKQVSDLLQTIAEMKAAQKAGAAAAPADDASAMDAEKSAAALDAKLALRETLKADARKVLGADAKLDGKPDAEIKRLVVAKALPKLDATKFSADRLDGAFVMAVAHAGAAAESAARNDALGDANRAALGDESKSTVRGDAGDEKDARAEMQAASANRWKQPTSVSAGKAG